jgi:hypothetical protein
MKKFKILMMNIEIYRNHKHNNHSLILERIIILALKVDNKYQAR